jgi:hypothetical protein
MLHILHSFLFEMPFVSWCYLFWFCIIHILHTGCANSGAKGLINWIESASRWFHCTDVLWCTVNKTLCLHKILLWSDVQRLDCHWELHGVGGRPDLQNIYVSNRKSLVGICCVLQLCSFPACNWKLSSALRIKHSSALEGREACGMTWESVFSFWSFPRFD